MPTTRAHDHTETPGFFFRPVGSAQLLRKTLECIDALQQVQVNHLHIETNILRPHVAETIPSNRAGDALKLPKVVDLLNLLDDRGDVEILSFFLRCPRIESNNGIAADLHFVNNGVFSEFFIKAHGGGSISSAPVGAKDITLALLPIFEHVPVSRVIPDTQEKALESRLLVLDKIAGALAASTGRTTEIVEKSVTKVLESATKTHEEAKKFINDETARLKAEADGKEAALAARVAEFEEIRKQFNDQNNTVVRRKLLDDIKAELAKYKTVELSGKTNEKHAYVSLVCNRMMIFFGLLAVGCLAGWYFSTGKEYVLIPAGTASLALITTLIFKIRWSSAWARQHAALETENIRFSYDMLRAAWFAELLFEYKKTKEDQFPESIAAVMTKGLFENREKTDEAKHPSDDLMKLLGKMKKVAVKGDGVEIGT